MVHVWVRCCFSRLGESSNYVFFLVVSCLEHLRSMIIPVAFVAFFSPATGIDKAPSHGGRSFTDSRMGNKKMVMDQYVRIGVQLRLQMGKTMDTHPHQLGYDPYKYLVLDSF